MTNPNVSALNSVVSAPIAEKGSAPAAPASVPVSTNQVPKAPESTKPPGQLFEHYDLAEEALKVEKDRIQHLAESKKYQIFEDSRSEAEKLR